MVYLERLLKVVGRYYAAGGRGEGRCGLGGVKGEKYNMSFEKWCANLIQFTHFLDLI